MTNRFPAVRSLSAAAVALLLASAAFADGPVKRRAVSPGGQVAELAGKVTDASTGVPINGVDVSTPGAASRTDTSGQFTLRLFTGRTQTLTFARSGYQTLTVDVNISGATTRTFQMVPRATTKVRTVNGSDRELDTETIEFGYVAPFSGYVKDTKLNLCAPGGASFTPDRADIRKITGPVQINDAVCCNRGSMPAINVQLKNGATTTAAFADACVGYQVDVIGRDHVTNAPVFIHFSEIAQIDFP